ncbi:MAG TPA: hypothetical protein VJ201_05920 [Candidatus Babeliales bacterium]|nr:hypothetical protein [Candidatus Babeliales bacterium]
MYRKCNIFYLLIVYLFLAVNSFAAQIPDKFFAYDKIGDFLLLYKSLEEGFCAGTLIKTPFGYEPIEDLQMGDIVLDMYGNPTEILATTRRYVDGYIKIFLEGTVLSAGCDQLLYSFSESSWIRARDWLLDSEHIVDPTFIYALTVQNHTLSVTPHDISAHNSAAIFAGPSSICCGYVAVINPVIAMLGGATVALAVIAYNARRMYLEKHKDENGPCLVDMPDAVVLAERFYYEQRKEALEKIKQELMVIKNDLQIIKGLCSGSFTHQFLQQHIYSTVKNVQLLSIAQEKHLSDDQKNTLRGLRENELALLEKQICDIQFLLALHVNQLLKNLHHARTSYDSAITEIREAIGVWNNNLKAMTHETALRLYKYDLLQERLVFGIRQAFNELLLVAEYYRICTSQCIQSSTTIVSALDQIVPVIHEKKPWILQQEEYTRNNITITEAHFASRNISVMVFKNEAKKEFDKQQKDRDTQVLKKIETALSVNSFSGGPKKDDDDDEERFLKIEIYEKNAAHIFRNEPGHFPIDTPVNRKLLIDVASDFKNFLGKCKYGNEWYGKILDNGQQIWVSMRNGFIRNGGLNKIPQSFNGQTGLCRLMK